MWSENWKILCGFSIFWSNFLWKPQFLNQNQYKMEVIHLDINGFLFINDSRNVLKRFTDFYNAFKSYKEWECIEHIIWYASLLAYFIFYSIFCFYKRYTYKWEVKVSTKPIFQSSWLYLKGTFLAGSRRDLQWEDLLPPFHTIISHMVQELITINRELAVRGGTSYELHRDNLGLGRGRGLDL